MNTVVIFNDIKHCSTHVESMNNGWSGEDYVKDDPFSTCASVILPNNRS